MTHTLKVVAIVAYAILGICSAYGMKESNRGFSVKPSGPAPSAAAEKSKSKTTPPKEKEEMDAGKAPAARAPSKRQAAVVPKGEIANVQKQIAQHDQNGPFYALLDITPLADPKRDANQIRDAYARINAAYGPRAPLPKDQNNPKGKRDRAEYVARVRAAANTLLKAHGQPPVR